MQNYDLNSYILDFKDLARQFSNLDIPIRQDAITLEELPWSKLPGVYIIHFQDTEYIYVGSAMTKMGGTIFGKQKVNNSTLCWGGDVVNGKRAEMVNYIKLERKFRFFAPAIESFLIEKMRQLGFKLVNKKG